MNESVVEWAALDWLQSLGWVIRHGRDLGPDGVDPERQTYEQVFLEDRLRQTLALLNLGLSLEALEDAFRKLTRPEGPTLDTRNRAFRRMLVDGVTVEFRREDGSIGGAQARVLDFEDPDNNDWLAVNQFTVTENHHVRRPDVVLFVNGLPLVLIELKNAVAENATIWSAYQQFQTYRAELPTLFTFNELLVVSDGMEARIGSLTAGREWFKPWRTISGTTLADPNLPELQVMIEGVFEDSGGGPLSKKIAGYHQFHAVNVAVGETLRAARAQDVPDCILDERGRYEAGSQPGGESGDRRAGVVWHTQGSGKNLTIAFYAGRIIREPRMANPTIVVITDRNDLDDQLFGTFSRCRDLLRQPPVQAES